MPHSCSPHRLVGGPIPTRCVVVPRQCQSPIVSVPDSVSPVGFSTQHRRTSWCEAALGQAACGCLGTAFDSTHCWPTPDTAHPEACFDEARWVQWVGAMRCEGRRTRATPMLASAPRSRHILCYPFLSGQSSTCSLRARSLPLFWPCLPARPWVRGGSRQFPEEAPFESVVKGHSADWWARPGCWV